MSYLFLIKQCFQNRTLDKTRHYPLRDLNYFTQAKKSLAKDLWASVEVYASTSTLTLYE